MEGISSYDLKELKIDQTQLGSFKNNNFPSMEILEIRNSPIEVLMIN